MIRMLKRCAWGVVGEVQEKWFVRRLLFQKLDSAVSDDVREVSVAADLIQILIKNMFTRWFVVIEVVDRASQRGQEVVESVVRRQQMFFVAQMPLAKADRLVSLIVK